MSDDTPKVDAKPEPRPHWTTRIQRFDRRWIFLAMGVGLGLAMASGAYADLSIDTSYGPLPADEL